MSHPGQTMLEQIYGGSKPLFTRFSGVNLEKSNTILCRPRSINPERHINETAKRQNASPVKTAYSLRLSESRIC